MQGEGICILCFVHEKTAILGKQRLHASLAYCVSVCVPLISLVAFGSFLPCVVVYLNGICNCR